MLILPRDTFGKYKQVPLHDVVIDWRHPLTFGLVSCWLPGRYGGIDLTRLTSPLTAQSAATGGVSPIDGPGLKSTASSSGYTRTAVAVEKSFSVGRTLFWRGQSIGLPPDFSTLIGTSYTDTDTAPYVIATIQFNVSTTQGWAAAWNSGGTVHDSYSLTTTVASYTAGEIFSIGATFAVGGNVVLYKNGSSVLTVGWQTGGAPTDTANSNVGLNAWIPVTTRHANGICNISCMWNRVLSATEMMMMQRWPYSFLTRNRFQISETYFALRPDGDVSRGNWTRG